MTPNKALIKKPVSAFVVEEDFHIQLSPGKEFEVVDLDTNEQGTALTLRIDVVIFNPQDEDIELRQEPDDTGRLQGMRGDDDDPPGMRDGAKLDFVEGHE